MRFGAPSFLPLLAVPAALLLLWFWQLWRRRADARAFMRRRQVPVDERIPFFGELLFWFFVVLAAGSAILALAKPQAVTSLVRTAGVDLVILQDGSASMHVTDVKGDRWQRSMRFLRTIGEALRWENDRVAMALFAHMATPQIRLTKDPNTYFLLSRSSRGQVAVPSRRRRHVGHEHRARHLLGPAVDREGRRTAPHRQQCDDEQAAAGRQREGVRAGVGRPVVER